MLLSREGKAKIADAGLGAFPLCPLGLWSENVHEAAHCAQLWQ